MVLVDKMRMSESSQNGAARVNLILDQCLQNKAFETGFFGKINVVHVLQFYSDFSLGWKRIKLV